MGVLDDAIREHIELKRKHGASDEDLRRQEQEALGPARREQPQVAAEPEAAAEAEALAGAELRARLGLAAVDPRSAVESAEIVAERRLMCAKADHGGARSASSRRTRAPDAALAGPGRARFGSSRRSARSMLRTAR